LSCVDGAHELSYEYDHLNERPSTFCAAIDNNNYDAVYDL